MSSGGTELSINSFDAIILTILGLSALVAFFRGFIRELLSLGAWVGAALITVYLFPHSDEFVKNHVKGGGNSDHVAAGIAALGTYIAALIGISIINSIILKYVKSGAEVGLLDNFLGLFFGAIRGAFIVSLGYLIMTAVIPKDNPPKWLKGSFTKEYLQSGADLLTRVAPKYLNDLEGFVKKKEEEEKERMDKHPDTGYKPDERKDLERLMDSTRPNAPPDTPLDKTPLNR